MKLRNLLVGMVVVAALSAGGVAAAGHYHTTQWWVNGLGDGHNNNNEAYLTSRDKSGPESDRIAGVPAAGWWW